jgi:hypothetical protein
MWIRKGTLLRRGAGVERGASGASAGGFSGGGRGPPTAPGAGPNRQTAIVSSAMRAASAAIEANREMGFDFVCAARRESFGLMKGCLPSGFNNGSLAGLSGGFRRWCSFNRRGAWMVERVGK